MKKNKLFFTRLLLILVFCLTLTSCGNNDNSIEEEQKLKDYNEALTMIENGKYEEAQNLFEKLGDYKDAKEYLSKFCYLPVKINRNTINAVGSYDFFFNENNLISKYETHREGLDATCDFFYDEKGDIIQQVANINGAISSFDYIYNANRQRDVATYKVEGVVQSIHKFIYNEKNLVKVYRIEDIEGNLLQQLTYTYDEKGDSIREEYVEPDYGYVFDIEYQYNDKGLLIKKSGKYDDGGSESWEYTYDANGNMIKLVYTDYDGSVYVYEYTYDDKGNVLKEILTSEDGVTQYVEYEYKLLYLPTGLTDATILFFKEIFEALL